MHRSVISSRWRAAAAIVLTFALLAAMPVLWAQENDWNKLMKEGDKAARSFKFAQAEKKLEAALVQTQAFPANDLRTALTLGKLSNLYARDKKFSEAEDLGKRGAAVMEAAVGPDDPRVAYALIRLALVFQYTNQESANQESARLGSANRSDDAALLWDRAVTILEKAGKPPDAEVVTAMENEARDLRMHGSIAGVGSPGTELEFAL